MKIFKNNGKMPEYLILCNDKNVPYSQYFLLYKGEEIQTTRTSSYKLAWDYFNWSSETVDVLYI